MRNGIRGWPMRRRGGLDSSIFCDRQCKAGILYFRVPAFFVQAKRCLTLLFSSAGVNFLGLRRRDSNPSMKPGFASVNFKKTLFPHNSLSNSSLSSIREIVSAFYPVFCAILLDLV